jgi:tripartite-type tricarboxylate transporter receptor subunit TctC
VKRFFCALGTLVALAAPAAAQPYPARPITMVISFAAGGPTDAVGRILVEGMRPALGQPIVIENVAGASGSLGAGRVARAAPDGYTIGLGHWGTHVINGAIYTLNYDLQKDFEPIALVSSNPQLIVGRKTLPPDDLPSLIAWLRTHPVLLGTTGVGGPSHMNGMLFAAVAGANFQYVPYRGLGPAMQDLIGGQIDMIIDSAPNSLPQVRAGTIKVYGVTSKERLPSAPDIPTANEAGLPGFTTSNWFALWAPARTPKDVLARLNAAAVASLSDPSVRARLANLGQTIFPPEQLTPEALSAFQKSEIDKWWPLIKAANIKAE